MVAPTPLWVYGYRLGYWHKENHYTIATLVGSFHALCLPFKSIGLGVLECLLLNAQCMAITLCFFSCFFFCRQSLTSTLVHIIKKGKAASPSPHHPSLTAQWLKVLVLSIPHVWHVWHVWHLSYMAVLMAIRMSCDLHAAEVKKLGQCVASDTMASTWQPAALAIGKQKSNWLSHAGYTLAMILKFSSQCHPGTSRYSPVRWFFYFKYIIKCKVIICILI